MMQTVIRLKRPLEESPSDTLILNYNSEEQKLDSACADIEPVSTVLKFTGTQHSANEDIAKHVAKLRSSLKDDTLKDFNNTVERRQKLRTEVLERSKSDRYRIVNCSRPNLSEDSDDHVTVIDIESGQKESETDADQKYVYDYYFTDARIPQGFDDNELDFFSIHAPAEAFDSGEAYVDSDVDSEDSNIENYFTNDYPDESDHESVNEEDIIEAMDKMGLEDALSSSDEEFVRCGSGEDFLDYRDYFDDEEGDAAFNRFKKKYGKGSSSKEESESESEFHDDSFY